MKNRDKVAISLPRELLDAVERLRRRSGETRSAVFERAIESYLASAQAVAESRRYVAAYRRSPESDAEQRAALASALEGLASEPWDA